MVDSDSSVSPELPRGNDKACEKDAGPKGDEEQSISAPLVLSQERMEEVCRRFHTLQEHLKRLQVRSEEQRKTDKRIQRKTVSQEHNNRDKGTNKDEGHNKR